MHDLPHKFAVNLDRRLAVAGFIDARPLPRRHSVVASVPIRPSYKIYIGCLTAYHLGRLAPSSLIWFNGSFRTASSDPEPRIHCSECQPRRRKGFEISLHLVLEHSPYEFEALGCSWSSTYQ